MPKLCLMITAAVVALTAQPAAADTVSDWFEFGNKLSPTMGQPDPDRTGARVALAMFEALNAIDPRYESYLKLPAGDRAASQDAAAATAAYRVLLKAYPASKTALDESYAITLAEIRNDKAREAGRLIGEQAATAALALSVSDPAVVQIPYRPVTTPGVWIGASLPALEPYWAAHKPWAMESATALMPPPPIALNSEAWARNYEEVRRLGGKTGSERTPHQTLMARFRQTPDLTPSFRLAADSPGRRPVQNARMYALYQMAVDDAAQAMVVAKIHYGFWRPITAIRNGADDGNAATAADPSWTPLLPTPNFQEYPCGHCTVAAAIGEVMKAEVGPRPAAGVRVSSMSISNSVVQVLPSWDEWVSQVSDSRIYAGVHYRFSNEVGETMGRRAARDVMAKLLRPLPAR